MVVLTFTFVSGVPFDSTTDSDSGSGYGSGPNLRSEKTKLKFSISDITGSANIVGKAKSLYDSIYSLAEEIEPDVENAINKIG